MNNLKKIRQINNKTQKDLSILLNIKEQQVYKLENNKALLTEDKIVILCKYFNITADLLLGLTNKIEL